MKLLNPATGAVIADIPEDGAFAVRRKYERARAAQSAWAATPIKKRVAAIRAFRDRIVAKHDTLARTLTQEVGKPIRQAKNELNGLLKRIDFFVAEAARVLRDEKVHFDEKQKLEERISHEPLGVIANISAWNYPYFVGSNVFVPALLAGNTVLYKPSEYATLTGRHIADTLHEAGVPADVFITVIGSKTAGAALLRQPVDGVFFTGSYATGAKIYDTHCKDCHRPNGEGVLPHYPPLANNQSIMMKSVNNPVRMVLNGGFPPGTESNPRPYGMPPFSHLLNDQEVAAVVTYVRRSWGNRAGAVPIWQVTTARGLPPKRRSVNTSSV